MAIKAKWSANYDPPCSLACGAEKKYRRTPIGISSSLLDCVPNALTYWFQVILDKQRAADTLFDVNKTKRKFVCRNLPLQVNPSPEYPAKQIQVKLPGVLVQLACELHPPLFTAHSSTSVQYHSACITLQDICILNYVTGYSHSWNVGLRRWTFLFR